MQSSKEIPLRHHLLPYALVRACALKHCSFSVSCHSCCVPRFLLCPMALLLWPSSIRNISHCKGSAKDDFLCASNASAYYMQQRPSKNRKGLSHWSEALWALYFGSHKKSRLEKRLKCLHKKKKENLNKHSVSNIVCII